MDNKTSFKTGALVVMTPVDAPNQQFRMTVTHCNPGIAVSLWNGARGTWESRPFLTLQPDGTWANGTGIRYTLTGGDRCRWFLNCQNEAITTQEHPILGSVPICQRCKDRIQPTETKREVNL